MKYPLVAYSWTAICPNTVFKRMDKSTFIHRGTGIPKQLSGFFNIPDVDSLPTHDESMLNQRVTRLLKRGITGKPKGHQFSSAKTSSHSVYYRDPMVKTWVLDNAKGTCELCGELRPFIDKTGQYFLGEHHVMPLADGGSDTVENAVALCPNCHRKCHLGQDIESTKIELLDKVDRISSVNYTN